MTARTPKARGLVMHPSTSFRGDKRGQEKWESVSKRERERERGKKDGECVRERERHATSGHIQGRYKG